MSLMVWLQHSNSQLAGFTPSLFVVISLEKVCLGADVNDGCAPVHSWCLFAVLTESGWFVRIRPRLWWESLDVLKSEWRTNAFFVDRAHREGVCKGRDGGWCSFSSAAHNGGIHRVYTGVWGGWALLLDLSKLLLSTWGSLGEGSGVISDTVASFTCRLVFVLTQIIPNEDFMSTVYMWRDLFRSGVDMCHVWHAQMNQNITWLIKDRSIVWLAQ